MEGKLAPRHVDERIAALAASQHGIVAAAQLRGLGLTPRQIEFRLRAGRLHAVGRWMASVLACGADAVLSHRAAAAHWGILPPTSGKIDVTLPRRTGRRGRKRIRVHRVAWLTDDERAVHEGIPLTTVARTVLDLAATLRRRSVERAVEESERRRLFDLAAVETLLERRARQPGTPLLRAVIDGYRDEHLRTRQELERLFLALCEGHRIARPEVNALVGPFEVDFLWAEQRLVVECDGRDIHATRAAFERDRARVTWRRVSSESDEVARLLRQLLARPR
jgi:predicted transcriptional regulator of viral defense system